MKLFELSRHIFLLVCIFVCYRGALAQNPTGNPIAEFYNGAEGYPAWTDEIRWNNVYNMATYDYSGCSVCAGNDFEKFKYLRDIAYAAGGGVLYYPGGTYYFDISDSPMGEGLMLKKGVVIRGEKPVSGERAVITNDIHTTGVNDHGLNSLPTKFVFGTTTLNGKLNGPIAKMWNAVGIKKGPGESGLHQVNHVGICWVEIQYGYVFFGFDANEWAQTYGQASYDLGKSIEPWRSGRQPDGTHPMDHFNGNKAWDRDSIMMGEKRFVFGVNLKNGGVPNYVLSHGLPVDSFYCEDSPWHFGAKIAVYGSHVLVANNVVAKAAASFPFRLTCRNGNIASRPIHTITVPYDFGKGLSIDINKNYIAGFVNRSQVENPSSQYAPDVILRDNFIYNHSNKSIDASGNWMVIKNNMCRRERYNKNTDVYGLGLPMPIWGTFTSNGRCRTEQSPDDYMARGLTLATMNTWIDSNQIAGTGTDYDNSGEGIIIQDHLNGSECFSTAMTRNKNANPFIISGNNAWMGVWNSHAVGLFVGYNQTMNSITLNPFGGYGSDVSEIQHVSTVTGLPLNPSGNVTIVNVRDFRRFTCPGDPMPTAPQVQVKDTSDFVMISWTNAENEAGYRVERRRMGDTRWTVIAYRPRQESGGNVTFGFGAVANGFIATNDGYPPAPFNAATWDGKTRNMNPPVWRDYTKMAGIFEYRVVAVGCDDTDEGSSDSVAVVVTVGNRQNAAFPNRSLLRVLPNPARDLLKLEAPGMDVLEWEILDVTGRRVWQRSGKDSVSPILHVDAWKSGMYTLRVNSSKESRTTRFVVN